MGRDRRRIGGMGMGMGIERGEVKTELNHIVGPKSLVIENEVTDDE